MSIFQRTQRRPVLSVARQSLQMRFSDQDVVDKIIESWSEKEIYLFKKFLSNPCSEARDVSIHDHLVTANRKRSGEICARIFKVSLQWDRSLLVDRFILKTGMIYVSELQSPGFLDNFEKLPSSTQEHLWNSKKFFTSFSGCSDRAFVELLVRTGLPADFGFGYFDEGGRYNAGGAERIIWPHYNFRLSGDFREAFSRDPERWAHLDLSRMKLAGRYQAAINSIFDPKEKYSANPYVKGIKGNIICFQSNGLEIMTMLRAIHGEQKVTEFVECFVKDKQLICADHAVRILDDWDEMKHYPAAWIASIHNYRPCLDHPSRPPNMHRSRR